MKRYKEQLSLNQTADSPPLKERFENYSIIINEIADESIVHGKTRQITYNNNINNTTNNRYKKFVITTNGVEEDKLKYYAIKIIKKILKVKENILKNPIPIFKNMSLISTHGKCTTNFFKIPDNLMICILTPLNRIATYSQDFIDEILGNLELPDFNNNFLSNPSCYLRNIGNSFLEFAKTFYPGQMCNDLQLSIVPAEMRNYHSYFKINTSINPFASLPGDDNIDATGSNSTTLSEFIKYKKISGILFVTCCRSCDLSVELIEETNKIYILETFTNILNKTIDNPEDSKYYGCNLLLKYTKHIAKYYKKSRNSNTNLFKELVPHKKIGENIKTRLNSNPRIRNKSLSPKPNKIHNIIQLILLSDSTDKQKYENIDKLIYKQLNLNIKQGLEESELNSLLEIFKKSLEGLNDNNEMAINYFWSCIFYNYWFDTQDTQDTDYIANIIDIYQKNPLMRDMTTLYLSGCIYSKPNSTSVIIANFFYRYSDSFPVKCLNISDNKELKYLYFGMKPKSLEKIDAHNCGFYIIDKRILELDNLKEINLDGNSNLSFDEKIFDNIQNNDKYTLEDKEYIKSILDYQLDIYNNDPYYGMVSYNDPDFKTHPKYSIFLKYLVDYPVLPKIESNTSNPNSPKKPNKQGNNSSVKGKSTVILQCNSL